MFSSLLQTWFDQGKIAGQSEDKPLKIDTEPFAEVNMVVEVNWPRKKTIKEKRKWILRSSSSEPRRPKASIIKGVVLCSKYKVECDPEVRGAN